MADPFSSPDFLKNLNSELDRQSVGASERARQEPKPKAKQKPALRGKPGSPERLAQVTELASQIDPTLVSEMAWSSVGTSLQNSLHAIRAFEESEYFDGENYPSEILDQFASASRMLAGVGDPQLYAAFANELEQTGSGLTEYLPNAVQQAEQQGHLEAYEVERAQVQGGIDQRHKMLETEYSDIARRTGPSGIEAADKFIQGLGDDAYNPALDEDAMRAAARATAEAAAATDRGISKMGFLAAFDKEAARSYGPGSSWSDEQREKWEAELRASTVETVEREFGSPELHDHRAVEGMLLDDRQRETGKPIFQEQVEHALDEHNSHARQNSPHLKAMAESDAREWEATHDESGHPLTTRDGLGRESEGRR